MILVHVDQERNINSAVGNNFFDAVLIRGLYMAE